MYEGVLEPTDRARLVVDRVAPIFRELGDHWLVLIFPNLIAFEKNTRLKRITSKYVYL